MTTFVRALRRTSVTTALVATGLLAACSGDTPTVPVNANAPARLAFNASVRFQTTGNALLRVQPAYLRRNNSAVALDAQSIALTDAATQLVPLTIELTRCLRDAERAGLNGATPADDECVLQVELALEIGGTVVDRDTIRSLSMRPGQTSSAPATITLSEVGTLRLTPPSANVVGAGQPLRLEATRALTIAAEVLDGANRTITRAITWTSSAPAVATVSNGVVTGVAAGTARITASVGGQSAFVDVRVVPLPQTVTIGVGTGSSGTGTVISTPAGINCIITGTTTSGTCAQSFPGDATVSFVMQTGASTSFVGWSGDCTGATGCAVVSSQPRTINATLRAFRTLTVTGSGTGNGSITAPNNVINCTWQFGSTSGGPCTAQLPDGAQITLTVSPQAQSEFTGWAGDCASATGASCTLTMNANRSVSAGFRAFNVYRLTSGTGTGTGVVTSNPAGMNCTVTGSAVAGTCSVSVPVGTAVSFTATATNGNSLTSWGGACGGTASQCTLPNLLTGSFNLTVGFERLATLSITPDARSTGTGQLNGTNLFFCQISGATVTSTACRGTYPAGTQVTINASTSGYTDFASWGGVCATQFSSRCSLTLSADAAATVRFESVPTAQFTVTGYAFDAEWTMRVQHPYQQQQSCTIRVSSSEEPTVCTFTVPVERDFTLSPVVPAGTDLYYQGLCESTPTGSPCTLRVTGDAGMYAYASSSSALRRLPALVKHRDGGKE